MKSIIIISGLSFSTNNRGTQALGYGAVPFLHKEGKLNENTVVISPSVYKNPFKQWKERKKKYLIAIEQQKITVIERKFWFLDIKFSEVFFSSFRKLPVFTPYGRTLRNTHSVAAICGGDGFSDIYSPITMLNHIAWIQKAKQFNIPYLFLPQTIGPFNKKENLEFATNLLQDAEKVYVRDTAFSSELEKMQVNYAIKNDLSYYMIPEKTAIKLPEGRKVGINISGLCYYNSFYNLKGKFNNYPLLLEKLVAYYQKQGVTIVLIPHSYNFVSPESNADDLAASREFYNQLSNQENVVLIDEDLKSPEIKYLISKMDFFIGSRMHSCFAAIFTNVPVFGLGYSYKYEHNFIKYNLPNNQASILDLEKDQIPNLLKQILIAEKNDIQ